MAYKGLRDWLEAIEKQGELKRISGADWKLEMASIAEIVYKEGKGPNPVLLFDDIPGYPKGFQALFGQLSSPWSITTSLGLPADQLDRNDILRNWRQKVSELQMTPPKMVKTSPVLANSDTGDKVDLFKFPSPRFHEMDSPNRYIGAGAFIQKDPDSGYVNVGTYRSMIVDCNRHTVHIVEGKQGSTIMHEKYFARGKAMPIAYAIGVDPALYLVSGFIPLKWGTSEYDYAGAIKGEPIEVFEGPYTGLLLPANAEIIIEGECHAGEEADEGPFGEWHGYYANLGLTAVPEPVIRVKAIHYRNDPILTCCQRTAPPQEDSLIASILTSEKIWSGLEGLGIPGIKSVWCHEAGHGRLFNVVSIKQLYAGHSRQVGVVACQYPLAGRFTIVVDDDVDPSNLQDITWALSTRTQPERSVQILPYCSSGSDDPAIPQAEKMKYRVPPKPLYSSRILIDACQPFEHKTEWYPAARISTDLRAEILKKWQSILGDLL